MLPQSRGLFPLRGADDVLVAGPNRVVDLLDLIAMEAFATTLPPSEIRFGIAARRIHEGHTSPLSISLDSPTG